MTMSLLRRVTGLIPLPVTTSPAPRPAPGLDVVHTPQRPGRTGGSHPPAAADLPDRALARLGVPERVPVAADLPTPVEPLGPPSWTPGLCYHAGHVDIGGHRTGVLPEPGDEPHRASLLRCQNVNEAGR